MTTDDVESIVESARGSIDAELLTGTGSGGFLSTGYFHSGPLVDRLDYDEKLQFVLTNLSKGVVIERSNETERVNSGWSYRTAALVTDQRTCFVVGQNESDVVFDVPHDRVEDVEASTGIFKDKLVIVGQNAEYQMHTTKSSDTEDAAAYIEEVAPEAGWVSLDPDESTRRDRSEAGSDDEDRDYSGVFRGRVPADTSYSGDSSSDQDAIADDATDDPSDDDTIEVSRRSSVDRYIQKEAEKRSETAELKSAQHASRATDGAATDGSETRHSEGSDAGGEEGATDEEDASDETDATDESDAVDEIDTTDESDATDENDAADEDDALDENDATPDVATDPVADEDAVLPSPDSVADVSEEAATHVENARGVLEDGLTDSPRSARIRAHNDVCVALETLNGVDDDVVRQLEDAVAELESSLETTAGTGDESANGRERAEADDSSSESQQRETATGTNSDRVTASATTSEETETDSVDTTEGGNDHREELLAELERLDEEWSKDVDKVLLYSVGEYDPADYEEEFGSWDAALRLAGLDEDAREEAEASERRERLLAELQHLDEEWSKDVDKVLLYSVGEYDPDEYEEAFGSWDAALERALGDEADEGDGDKADLDHDASTTETHDESTRDGDEPEAADVQAADGTEGEDERADRDESDGGESEAAATREQLLDEINRLEAEWDTEIDEILMEVLGDYDPETYVDEFGSWDEALRQAERRKGHSSGPDEVGGEGDEANETRDQLLAELERLDEQWSKDVDKVLMYSVGEYEPDEYEEEFGSWEAALDAAGLGSTTDSDDTTRENSIGIPNKQNSVSRPPETDTSSSQGPVSSGGDGGIEANELAEYYDAMGAVWNVLDQLLELDDLGEVDATRETLTEWYDAVHERWAGDGVGDAPSYGEQQYERNPFAMSEYRDVFGDGDRVTEFHRIDVEPLPSSKRSLLEYHGITAGASQFRTPVAPESDEPLPVVVESRSDLRRAKELLDELPRWPSAEVPPETESDHERTGLESLPDGRLDELTVTVEAVTDDPDDRRSATLTVSLDDGSETTFTSWEKHSLDQDWTVGGRYLLREARHKSWRSGNGTGHELSSTRDTEVEVIDDGDRPQTEDTDTSRSSDDEESQESNGMIDAMLSDMDL